MKAIYLLALFAVSSHAHEGNAIFHYHVSDYLILAVVTVVTFGVIRILKRRVFTRLFFYLINNLLIFKFLITLKINP